MNTEKILEKLNFAIELLPENDKKYCKGLIYGETKNLSGSIPTVPVYLAEAVVLLQEELMKQTAKASNKTSAVNAAKRILKSAKMGSVQKFYHAYIDGDHQIICDGYQLVVLSETDKLPLPAPLEYISNTTEHEFDYRKYISKNERWFEIPLPTIQKLSANIKIKKAEIPRGEKNKQIYYDFGAGSPLVKADQLLNVLEILGNCKAYALDTRNRILLENEKGSIGALMPVVLSDEKRRTVESRVIRI